MLTNQQKLRYTSITALMLQVTTLVCGFILPKMYLTYYGSTVNGLVSSITQFLGFIALAECGVGAVVRSAFYKPLAQKDNYDLSLIVVSSDSFFRKIALLLAIYVVVLIGFTLQNRHKVKAVKLFKELTKYLIYKLSKIKLLNI